MIGLLGRIGLGALIALGMLSSHALSGDAGETAAITGVISDSSTGEVIPLANVTLAGTHMGDAADNLGRFEIANVPPGSYVLSAAVVGYRTETLRITVEEGQHLDLALSLEPTAIEISPVVVTASRREQAISDVAVTVSVLGPKDIEKYDALSPDELLRQASGVVVTETQANIRGSGGFNRGAGSRLLLLLDGIPVLAGDTGDAKWDLVPPQEIERIEVVKSAASAMYGSNALGGVVNMITLPIPDRPQTRFRVSAGYFDDPYYPEWKWTSDWLTTAGLDLSHSRKIGETGLLVAVGKKTSDGYRRNSGFDRSSAMAKVTRPLGSSRFLTGLVAWALEDHGHSTEWTSQSQALDIARAAWNDKVRSEKLAGYLKLTDLFGVRHLVTGVVDWYYTAFDNDLHDVKDNAQALKLGGSVQADMILGGGRELTLGVEGSHTGVASTMFGDRQTGQIGIFSEARADLFWNSSVSVGARYDGHHLGRDRQWQDLLSPRAAVVVRPASSATINISVGRGFRAPTIAEMFTSTSTGGFTVKPNPGLSSEKGTTFEIGCTGSPWSGLGMALAVFRSDYSNLIEPGVDPADGKIHFTNVQDARVSGLEAQFEVVPLRGALRLRASYMYLSTEDKATGEPLAYRSKHNLTSSLEAYHGIYSVGLDFHYRSRVERVKVYEQDERLPIRVTDLRGAIDMGRLRLSAKVSNLLQYNYTEIERTLAPIRQYTLTLTGDY